MLVLRLDYRNGLHQEFNILDIGRAVQVRDYVAKCMIEGEIADFFDDAGRHPEFRTEELISVSLVDPVAEAYSILNLNQAVASAQRAWGEKNNPSAPIDAGPMRS